MEIIRTRKLYALAGAIFLLNAPALVSSEITLQKVPLDRAQSANESASRVGPQAAFALVNYSLKQTQAKPQALYVSSGENLSSAAGMIDNQAATSFAFSTQDKNPTALIDLGKNYVVRRLSVTYSPRVGSFDFYVLQSLPSGARDDFSGEMKLERASLRRIGWTTDDGTKGRASIEIPATNGRYVMVQWIPAAHNDSSFTVAEITAVGTGGAPLLASSGRFLGHQPSEQQTVAVDAKDIPDAKDVYESKDIPAEAPELPPPLLPDLPPFTFIPVIVPVSQ